MLAERALTLDDVPAALALSTGVRWNQSAADWAMLLALGSGFGLFAPDGTLVATAVVLPYARRFAWIGMVIVSEAFRRAGLATRLLQRCVDTIAASGAVPILDATPAGRDVYRKLGFIETWELQRYTGMGSAAAEAPGAGARIRRMEPRDVDRVRALDEAAFGADRTALFRCLLERRPEGAFVAEGARGSIAGLAIERAGRTATQLGPVVAADSATALALIAHAVRSNAGPLMIDVPLAHAAVNAWLERHRFTVERPFTRMQYGVAVPYGEPALSFAIAGPELG